MSVHSMLRVSVRLGVLAVAGVVSLAVVQNTTVADGREHDEPLGLRFTGIVRDFQERSMPTGHPDFERQPDHGFGRYVGNVAEYLGADFKPVFTKAGRQLISEWRDERNRPIYHTLFDPVRGDQAGVLGPEDTGGIESAETFSHWFRDTPGKNTNIDLRCNTVPSITAAFD